MLPNAPTASFPYRILGLVGEGGMGEVYHAEDVELGRPVAIKVLKRAYLEALSHHDRELAMRRFVQEARAAAKLSHPGITVVHRVGAEGAWPYIAMEWLDGETVDELLQRSGRLPIDHAVRIGLALLGALSAAHRAGVVHRDVKPANVFITRDRRVKLTDFGVARVQGSTMAQTQLGVIVGTAHYAAPEQLAGQPVDARADLYAVGAMLYEMITGRPPFDASSLYELFSRVREERPAKPSSLVPGLSSGLDRLLLTALAKSPEDRYTSAQEMIERLQPFLTLASPARAGAAHEPPPEALGPPEVATARVDADDPLSMLTRYVLTWPSTPLGEQESATLIRRLLERPVHTAPFCGAVVLGGATLLLGDGVLFDAVNASTGEVGDAVLDALPPRAVSALHPCPAHIDPKVVQLLASLAAPPSARLSGLDAALVDVPQLAAKLTAEGFDGVVRATREGRVGFVFFSRGKRVLDLFGGDWPYDPTRSRWEAWIARAGASVSVEDRRSTFPSASYRHRLRDVALDVHRGEAVAGDEILRDTRATAEALQLIPAAAEGARAGDSTLQALINADPAAAAARWLLVDTPLQFEQFRRGDRWKAMLAALPAVRCVRLHHPMQTGDGVSLEFDATTFDGEGRAMHVIDRVAAGSPDAVGAFIDRVITARRSARVGEGLVGAVLIAPSFSEAALDAYLGGLRAARGSVLRAAMDLLTHREGYLSVGRGGCHILLVEERDGRRRPLVMEG